MRQLGILQILLSGFCFGFLGIFGKWAFQYGLSPGEFLALRFLVASFLLGVYLLFTEGLRVSRQTFLACTGLGVLGYAIFSSCFFQALTGLSASLTVLLLYAYPVIVSTFAWIFLREKLSRWEVLSIPVVLFGLYLLLARELEVRSGTAVLFGLGSALFYSLYILCSRKFLKHVSALQSTFYIMLSAGVTLGIFYLRENTLAILPLAWKTVLATSLIGTLAAMSLFLAGLKKLTSAEASILSASEPLCGIILATLVLGESLSLLQYLGGLFVLAGMGLTSWAANKGNA